MNVKERIKERVNGINDPRLLDELLKAVELEHEIEHIDEISDVEKKRIDEGISDAEAGNLHTNLKASQLVKQWLKSYDGQHDLLLIERTSRSIGYRVISRTSILKNLRVCLRNRQNLSPIFRTWDHKLAIERFIQKWSRITRSSIE